MNFINTLQEFVMGLEGKTRTRMLGIVFVVLFGLVGTWWYFHTSRIDGLIKKLASVNSLRLRTKKILAEHEQVKQQQQEVTTILEKEKNFKIVEYFNAVLRDLGLQSLNSKQPVITEEDLQNGYTEIKLDAGFTGMNTKQLSELLFKIEQNERVFTKELNITKSMKSPTIDVSLVIATLQPRIS